MPEPTDVPTAPAGTSTGPPRRRTLLVMIGDDVQPYPVPLVGRLTVGRSSSCDVRVDHASISRTHLQLAFAHDQVTVTDLESANGVLLRGIKLPANTPVEITANEAVTAGDVTLVVQDIRGVATATPTPRAPAASSGRASRVVNPLVSDPAMRRLHDLAARVARGTISILLVGETGTGKEVLAELVHRASPRASGPLVRINCAALSETLVESELFGHEKGAFTGAQQERAGLIEAGHGGTVLLDEIGEIPLAMQAKLLRVLEEGTVMRVGATQPRAIDVRFVSATNRDLEADSTAGRFRRDLYFRLAGVVLAIPPLRDRADEVLALARRFVAEAAAKLERPALRFDEPALAALRAHAWPGNVRELRNVVERAALLADDDTITVEQLPFAASAAPKRPPAPGGLSDELATIERERILAAIEQCGGNQTRAAELLGMPRRTLIKRLGEYGLARPRKK